MQIATLPLIIVAGQTYAPLAISQDGYQAKALVDVQVLTLDLGAGFTYAHPCHSCHRGLMPCCERCQGAGHAEGCESEEAVAILARLQAYALGDLKRSTQ